MEEKKEEKPPVQTAEETAKDSPGNTAEKPQQGGDSRRCVFCGSPLADDDTDFCPKCCLDLRCAHCDAAIADPKALCPNCGKETEIYYRVACALETEEHLQSCRDQVGKKNKKKACMFGAAGIAMVAAAVFVFVYWLLPSLGSGVFSRIWYVIPLLQFFLWGLALCARGGLLWLGAEEPVFEVKKTEQTVAFRAENIGPEDKSLVKEIFAKIAHSHVYAGSLIMMGQLYLNFIKMAQHDDKYKHISEALKLDDRYFQAVFREFMPLYLKSLEAGKNEDGSVTIKFINIFKDAEKSEKNGGDVPAETPPKEQS